MRRRMYVIALATLALLGLLSSPIFASGAQGDGGNAQLTVGYSNAELVNVWRVTNQRDFDETAKEMGIMLISIDADQDPAKQLADCQSLIAQGVDVLILSPIEAQSSVPVVDMCAKADIPLIVIDRSIEAEPGVGAYKTNIFQSHYLSGQRLAEKAVEILTKKYGEPRGNVVHVQGMAGASVVIDANEGWDDVMAKYPNIKTVATADALFTKEGGMRVMEDFLQKFPKGEIDIVRSDYSDMTMGAIEAIKNAGRNELLGYIVGEGGHYKAIEAVIDGVIARETQTPPYSAKVALETAVELANGKTVPALGDVPALYFDADNVEEAKAYLDKIRSKGLEF